MATGFVYPTAMALREIAQDLLPRLTGEREIFNLLPIETVDEFYLSWEQMDNYTGLQAIRGLDGAPPRVKAVGAKRFTIEPGVFGEFENFSERELTTARRQLGTWDTVLDLNTMVYQKQARLLQREYDRIEQIGWTLLTTGTFSVAQETGGVIASDTYTTQTYRGTTWATTATATPLADIRNAQLLSRGHSVSFGAGARLYVNRATANNILANSNATDLGGRLSVGIAGILPLTRSITDVNQFLGGQDLPQFSIYDQGYLNDAGIFQLYIPNGKAILVGQRQGAQNVGAYRMCRNANNPEIAAGSYTKIIDRGENHVPRTVEVHQGHNGGPVMYWPSAVVIVDVS